MKIDVFWIWFLCFWLAAGMQNFLTIKKSSFDVSYHFKMQESEGAALGQIVLTAENCDSMSFVQAGRFIKKDLEESLGETVSVVILNISKRETIRYWHPFWKESTSS